MRFGIIFPILVVGTTYLNTSFGTSAKPMISGDSALPWHVIAEEYLKLNKYTFQPSQPIIINLPVQASSILSPQKASVNIDKNINGSWSHTCQNTANVKGDKIEIANGIGNEGFYRLLCPLKTRDGTSFTSESYIIIYSNWKRDILIFCRELKEQIETNPDPQLIRSTIAISHLDYAMELVSRETELSETILAALNNAVQSKKDFEEGKCPDLVTGLNKIRLKRFEGAAIEEFAVFVPDNYTDSGKWPVLLHTGDTGWSTRDKYPSDYNMIDIWWHTVSHKEIRWKDYQAFMGIIEKKLNIDKDRIYVNGDCMNGITAIALALNYPDQWAECSATLGNSYRYLASNALNLPIIFVKGQHNEDLYEGYYDFAIKCFQYYGCRNFKWSQTQEVIEVRGGPAPERKRESNPQRVFYTTETLDNSSSYWIKINGREDENLLGSIDAHVEGQTINIKTKNIDAYTLNLVRAPLDSNIPIEIVENGKSLGHITAQAFQKRANKHVDAVHVKNEHLHGPVWDVFTDPYIVIRPTGNEFSEAGKKAAVLLANGGPIYDDSNMPEQLIESHNLVLIGPSRSNQLLSKIPDKLPVRIESGRIITHEKSYNQPNIGFILIYPNPLNPEKYVAVFSGTSTKAMENIHKAYSQMKEIRPADVGIFEVTETDDIKWYILEKFNTVWDWHSGWNSILITTERKHPKWQWRQWVAMVIKKQLEVDVVICEDPFLLEDSQLTGQITYRDLFNAFRNDWIIRIELSGRELKKLLTVPYTDISKRKIDILIIEGISLTKNNEGINKISLSINEIENDKKYTVAIPEKCLNGQRMGVTVSDYQMLGEVYLLPVLTEYLTNNTIADLDAELEDMNMNMF